MSNPAWVKGMAPVNPGGCGGVTKPFLDALKRISVQQPEKLRAIAQVLMDKALDGEPWAIQMLADRLDGKAVQQIEATTTTLNLYLALTEARARIDTIYNESLVSTQPVQVIDYKVIDGAEVDSS